MGGWSFHGYKGRMEDRMEELRGPESVVYSTEVVHTDVGSLNGGLGGTETETDVLVPAAALGLWRNIWVGGLFTDTKGEWRIAWRN
jgi:hypothetical protein